MNAYKITVKVKDVVFGDLENRVVDEEGKNKILSDAATGKWGRDAHLAHGTELTELERNTFPSETDEMGMTLYNVPAEYSIEIVDITEEYEAEIAEIEKEHKERDQNKAEVKYLVSWVDTSTLDHRLKKILKTLIREVLG